MAHHDCERGSVTFDPRRVERRCLGGDLNAAASADGLLVTAALLATDLAGALLRSPVEDAASGLDGRPRGRAPIEPSGSATAAAAAVAAALAMSTAA
eukprot:365408-Chlamydomonas_euryale.AAC.20